MLQVVSFSETSDLDDEIQATSGLPAVTSRRGGFLHGTKIATDRGWTRVERLRVGDRVRTLDNGFREVRRISTDEVNIPKGEMRIENLPVQVPAQAAYNGRPVWLMPEQGMALDHSKMDKNSDGVSVLPARMLSGTCRLRSRSPGSTFQVSSLFFDEDEVIFIEGGFQAYCSAGRFTSPVGGRKTYEILNDESAAGWIDIISRKADISAFANSLGALPAPIPQEPIFPIRPPKPMRRPGRPGRPGLPALFLRPEWQT